MRPRASFEKTLLALAPAQRALRHSLVVAGGFYVWLGTPKALHLGLSFWVAGAVLGALWDRARTGRRCHAGLRGPDAQGPNLMDSSGSFHNEANGLQ